MRHLGNKEQAHRVASAFIEAGIVTDLKRTPRIRDRLQEQKRVQEVPGEKGGPVEFAKPGEIVTDLSTGKKKPYQKQKTW